MISFVKDEPTITSVFIETKFVSAFSRVVIITFSFLVEMASAKITNLLGSQYFFRIKKVLSNCFSLAFERGL